MSKRKGGRERERGIIFLPFPLCVCEAGGVQSGLHICWGSHVNTHKDGLARLAEEAEVDTTVRKDKRLKDGGLTAREIEERWGLNPRWPVW